MKEYTPRLPSNWYTQAPEQHYPLDLPDVLQGVVGEGTPYRPYSTRETINRVTRPQGAKIT